MLRVSRKRNRGVPASARAVRRRERGGEHPGTVGHARTAFVGRGPLLAKLGASQHRLPLMSFGVIVGVTDALQRLPPSEVETYAPASLPLQALPDLYRRHRVALTQRRRRVDLRQRHPAALYRIGAPTARRLPARPTALGPTRSGACVASRSPGRLTIRGLPSTSESSPISQRYAAWAQQARARQSRAHQVSLAVSIRSATAGGSASGSGSGGIGHCR